jgi:hypothetical protein
MVMPATAMHHVFRLQKGCFRRLAGAAELAERVRIGGHHRDGNSCTRGARRRGYYYSAKIRFADDADRTWLGIGPRGANRWFRQAA